MGSGVAEDAEKRGGEEESKREEAKASSPVARRCAAVFWDGGAHSTRRDLKGHRQAPPLSKLHQAGREVLEAAGWCKVARDTTLVPAFSWTVRHGGDHVDIASRSQAPPPVRQFPQDISDLLDDKRELCLTLEQGFVSHLAPATIVVDAHTLPPMTLHQGSQTSTTGVVAARSTRLQEDADDEDVWFFKHRRGVKGQAVTPVFSSKAAEDRIANMPTAQLADVVVQRAVPRRHLLNGHKWCMRVHVLEVAGAARAPYPEGARCWMHGAVIALPYARAYSRADRRKDAWVQQAGSKHPRPTLLQDTEPALYRQLVPSMKAMVHLTMQALRARVMREPWRLPSIALASDKTTALPVDSRRVHRCQAGGAGEGGGAAGRLILGSRDEHGRFEDDASTQDPRHSSAPDPRLQTYLAHDQLYQVYGFDLVADEDSRVWLLEVNSYPAIASGTMRAVDTHVYTELVRDVVSLVVLPAISNTAPHAGSFLPCDL